MDVVEKEDSSDVIMEKEAQIDLKMEKTAFFMVSFPMAFFL